MDELVLSRLGVLLAGMASHSPAERESPTGRSLPSHSAVKWAEVYCILAEACTRTVVISVMQSAPQIITTRKCTGAHGTPCILS